MERSGNHPGNGRQFPHRSGSGPCCIPGGGDGGPQMILVEVATIVPQMYMIHTLNSMSNLNKV